MPTKVLVPLLGEGVEEVSIVNWLKAEGDFIEEFEGLVEVETDKVVTEIPSPISGTLLKILIPKTGQAVPVGTILAWIGEAGEPIPEAESAPTGEHQADIQKGEIVPKMATTPEHSPAAIPMGRDSVLGFISPLVAKIAAEKGIDLSQVQGTGLDGRITKKDVLASTPGIRKPDTSSLDTLIPHTSMRRRIAEHMSLSKRTSPHVTTVMEADLSRVMAHRQTNKDAFAHDGTRLTLTAYFAAATAQALKAFPFVNSSWSEEGILLHSNINIGMATDLGDEGLIVPVIKNADRLSLLDLAEAVNDLAEKARSNKLTPSDVQGGTITITNHGISGSLFAAPIINQPQCAILGVGVIQKRVKVITDAARNDSIAIRPMVYLSLTFDHRILDGAGADHFLARVVELLENW